MSPLAKILIVFAGMLLLSRLRIPLGAALILGGLTLDRWAGAGSSALALDLQRALSRPELWLLLAITTLILVFGRFMAEERNAGAILAAARRWGGRHGRVFSLMAIPAAIGLVPMPGGALFSAPLVAQTVREENWSPDWKSAVNYWFRHVWEYWWPLYPVVIVSLPMFPLETWQFMATTIWFTPVSFVAGYVFLVRPNRRALVAGSAEGPEYPARAAFLGGLLLLIVLCTLLLPFLFEPFLPGLSLSARKMLAMLVGMAGACGLILRDDRLHGRHRPWAGLLTRKTASILLTLGGVLVFESLLNASGLLPAAGQELALSGVPPVAVVAFLPFIAGLVTGIAVGFAGAAFPLVVGLIGADGTGLGPMATLALAFGFGYAGMMLSPVHLCLILTRQYFSASFPRIYRQILPCIVALLVASIVLHLLLWQGGW